jgi:hypothetical protein
MQESASNQVRLDLRFRKPFPASSFGLLRLTQTHSSQALPEIRIKLICQIPQHCKPADGSKCNVVDKVYCPHFAELFAQTPNVGQHVLKILLVEAGFPSRHRSPTILDYRQQILI